MRALCVGRHEYLSDHLGRFFGRYGLETACVVGIESAAAAAAAGARPDVVICDYDLLATTPLDSWERDERLSRTPVVAVSMTRRPDELHPLDVNGIGGFLYLPQLERTDVGAALRAVAATSPFARAVLVPGLADAAGPPPRPSPAAAAADDWSRPVSAAVVVPASAAHLPPPPSARDEATAR